VADDRQTVIHQPFDGSIDRIATIKRIEP